MAVSDLKIDIEASEVIADVPLCEIQESYSKEFDGFYETQMMIKNNIKQINKNAKLITAYTEQYKLEICVESVSDINLKIENIIQNNANITNKIQTLIKTESDKISILSSTPTTYNQYKLKDIHNNRAKGESLNVLIKSFKKSIQFYYLSLSIYNQTVCTKQMEQLHTLTDSLTNCDIEKLIGFTAQERQQFIQEKFANYTNTPRIKAMENIKDIEKQRKEMEKIKQSVEDMKRLDATLNTLAIIDEGSFDDEEMEMDMTHVRSPIFGGKRSFSMKELKEGRVSLDIMDEHDVDYDHEEERNKDMERRRKRRRRSHGCKICSVVWIFIIAVVTFAIFDVQMNGQW